MLDANVLIALATPDHSEHERVRRWFDQGVRFATCPISQGALIRFYLRWAIHPSYTAAKKLLQRISELPNHEFWADDVSFLEVPERGILGHRQVTDAYLVALARSLGGCLATLDKPLAAFFPSHVTVI